MGITIALIGGSGYESADDWAALLACGIIAFNGINLAQARVQELMDRSPSEELHLAVRTAVGSVAGVWRVEKCRARKYGLGYIVDLHIEVDEDITVKEGHRISHAVKGGVTG